MTEKTILNAELGQKLDRTIPITLRPFFTKEEWEPFCEKGDKILTQYRKERNIAMAIMLGGAITGFLLFMVGGFLSVSQASFDNSGPSPVIFVAMAIFLACPISGGVFLSCYVNQKAMDQMKELCEETSKGKYNVSMHFKIKKTYMFGYGGRYSHRIDGMDDGYGYGGYYRDTRVYSTTYIEVLHPAMGMGAASPVATAPAFTAPLAASPVAPSAPVSPSAPMATAVEIPLGGDSGTTARERLENLEKIKDMLSPREYDAKRKEILDELI